jgi:PKD repeat protein
MAVGQMTAVIPSAYAAAEASSSTSYPWNRNSANGHRIQYCYDSSLFSQASPILISRLRWRANGTTSTWTGVTHPNVKIDLSSATVDQAALSTTFASNHGNDRANVFSGNVVVAPSPAGGGTTPNIFYVDVQFTAPFLYDPSAGNDLLIDITLPGGWTNGTTSTSLDCEYNTTSPNASRMYSLSDANSPTGSFQAGVAPVIEMTYNPATGIYANFDATPVEGKSPLQVQFTDKTFTSDPNGVTKWEWDFNNDQVIDSTAQNPQFTFTGVGYDVKYTVSLKVTDGTNGSNTLIKKDYIVVNPFPVASATPFGAGSTVPTGVPGPIQMTPYSRTYSSSSQTRGWWAQAPVTFVINGFDVPNEQSATHQSVWFFTTPANSQPSSYTPTAADTKFLGTGPVGTTLTPSAPIVVQQGTWFGVLGACHDAAGTTMHNSYDAGTTANQNDHGASNTSDARSAGSRPT